MIDYEHVMLVLSGFAWGAFTVVFIEAVVVPTYARWLVHHGHLHERRRRIGGRRR